MLRLPCRVLLADAVSERGEGPPGARPQWISRALSDLIAPSWLKLKNYVILLSPSAASFDQFKSFEDRGNQFKKIVSQQIEQGIV